VGSNDLETKCSSHGKRGKKRIFGFSNKRGAGKIEGWERISDVKKPPTPTSEQKRGKESNERRASRGARRKRKAGMSANSG